MIKYQLAHLNTSYNMNTLKYPISVYYKVTSNCMLNCSFCSQGDMKKQSMDIDKAKDVLNQLKNLGIDLITYTGGEPLLYKYIDELIKYGKELGFEQVLVTNGLHLLKHKSSLKYIDVIGVSIHGSEKIHDMLTQKKGSYQEALNNLKEINKIYPNIKITINYTVSDVNYNDKNIDDVYNLCSTNNYKLSFARINYIGNSKNYKVVSDYNKLLEKVSKLKEKYNNIEISNCIIPCSVDKKYEYLTHSCGAGMAFCSIEPNFDVKICSSSYDALGNLNDSSFKKIWNNKRLKKFKSLKWLPLQCRSCKSFEKCKGGCHAEDNKKFEDEMCDSLFNANKDQIIKKIFDKELYIKLNKIRKENNKYILINYPATITNKKGLEIIQKINDNYKFSEIVKMYSSEKNIEDFLLCLYRDNILGVKDEK